MPRAHGNCGRGAAEEGVADEFARKMLATLQQALVAMLAHDARADEHGHRDEGERRQGDRQRPDGLQCGGHVRTSW